MCHERVDEDVREIPRVLLSADVKFGFRLTMKQNALQL